MFRRTSISDVAFVATATRTGAPMRLQALMGRERWKNTGKQSLGSMVPSRSAATEAKTVKWESRTTWTGKNMVQVRVANGNLKLKVDTDQSLSFEQGDFTGMQVWPAADFVIKHLQRLASENKLQGKRIIELGSGTGMAGLAAMVLGAEKLVLTDRRTPMHSFALSSDGEPEQVFVGYNEGILDLLRENVRLNGLTDRVSVRALTWGDKKETNEVLDAIGGVDLVLGSDLLYSSEPEIIRPLFITLHTLLSHRGAPEDASAILAWQQNRTGSLRVFNRLCEDSKLKCELKETTIAPNNLTGLRDRTMFLHHLYPRRQ